MLKVNEKNFFKYEMIGEFRTEQEWIHPERIIDTYEMIFVLEGQVFIAEDGINFELQKNDILILEPGKRHRGVKTSTSPTAFYWFHFSTDMELPGKKYIGDEYHELKQLLKKLLHVTNLKIYPQETADAIGLVIFFEYVYVCGTTLANNTSLMKKIEEYIRINAPYNISVRKVGEYFGYNPDYIGRLFKKNHGIGLKEYIASERIKIAKDLLLTTELSVKEIAAKLNFREENLFIKFFMYHEEISPVRFRNKFSNTHMNNC